MMLDGVVDTFWCSRNTGTTYFKHLAAHICGKRSRQRSSQATGPTPTAQRQRTLHKPHPSLIGPEHRWLRAKADQSGQRSTEEDTGLPQKTCAKVLAIDLKCSHNKSHTGASVQNSNFQGLQKTSPHEVGNISVQMMYLIKCFCWLDAGLYHSFFSLSKICK